MRIIAANRPLLVSIIFLLLVHFGKTIKLKTNGGYDIVIAIEETIKEPENIAQYVDNIRSVMGVFSTQLWMATKEKFFIDSIDLLIPQNWNTASSPGVATTQAFNTAAIRISDRTDVPSVHNPNACSSSGTHIDLPLSFFSKTGYGPYGAPGKALLNQWARYRFGVWEEHGYPESDQFPYFYQKPSFTPKWTATGCSHPELFGKYVDQNGEETKECSTENIMTPPNSDCRFVPSNTNTANSSLMHFHWLDSITEFCDKRTHNPGSPNRQNLFCGHRSVWEVIRESTDFKTVVGAPLRQLHFPIFTILKASPKPLFYLLLDKGRTSNPLPSIRQLTTSLNNFLNGRTISDNLAAFGTFPNTDAGKSSPYVKEEVSWSVIGQCGDFFANALDEATNVDGPIVRDFGAAIKEVIDDIKVLKHEAGSVILVVKKGAGINTFNKLEYEYDVIASLKEQTNIRIFAVELQENTKTPFLNLEHLVKESGGHYLSITSPANTAQKLIPILRSISDALEQPIKTARKYNLIYKGFMQSNSSIEIPVLEEGLLNLEIHLTTTQYVSKIVYNQLRGNPVQSEYTVENEWSEDVDARRRIVHKLLINNPEQESAWTIKYDCNSREAEDCIGFITAYGRIDEFSKMLTASEATNILISTSADNNYIDMSIQGLQIVPFAIFAKVSINEQPVLNLKSITAVIRLTSTSKHWNVPLIDDGAGTPDVSMGDGIYSNVFIPLIDGSYSISVVIEYIKSKSEFPTEVSATGRLLPVDQKEIGCYESTNRRCIHAIPNGSFGKLVDMHRSVLVENTATFFPGKPLKIMDFKVHVRSDFHVEFSFTSPKLIGSDDSPDEFNIYMAPQVNNFIGSTELTKLLVAQIGSKHGTIERIPYYTAQKALPYYAVEALYRGMRSGPSNVVGVNTAQPSPTTTTTPTISTSTTPITTSISPTTPTSVNPTPTSISPTPTSNSPTTTNSITTLTSTAATIPDIISSTTTISTTSPGVPESSTTERPVSRSQIAMASPLTLITLILFCNFF